jgi:hypothetical protein
MITRFNEWRNKMNYKTIKIGGYIKPPCSKCPYKLGIIQTVRNPCLECKANGYKAYEWFTNQRNKQVNYEENADK